MQYLQVFKGIIYFWYVHNVSKRFYMYPATRCCDPDQVPNSSASDLDPRSIYSAKGFVIAPPSIDHVYEIHVRVTTLTKLRGVVFNVSRHDTCP